MSDNLTAEQPDPERGPRQLPAWLAERLETNRRRREQRQADRDQFAERRSHGLLRRHANKLRRQGGDRRGA